FVGEILLLLFQIVFFLVGLRFFRLVAAVLWLGRIVLLLFLFVLGGLVLVGDILVLVLFEVLLILLGLLLVGFLVGVFLRVGRRDQQLALLRSADIRPRRREVACIRGFQPEFQHLRSGQQFSVRALELVQFDEILVIERLRIAAVGKFEA